MYVSYPLDVTVTSMGKTSYWTILYSTFDLKWKI